MKSAPRFGGVNPRGYGQASGAGTNRRAAGRGPRSRGTLPAALAFVALLAAAALLAPVIRGGWGSGAASTAASRAAQARAVEAASLPPAARAQVSAALGADKAAFQVRGAAGELKATNPTQGLQASFSRSGVTLSAAASSGAATHLSLRTLGFGGAQRRVAAADPVARLNGVRYDRGSVSEWYANGPAGLEQGFTLAQAPAGEASAPLTLSMSLTGGARAKPGSNGRSVEFRTGSSVLSYGGLLATDASGRALHSWMEVRGNRLLIEVDAAQARYPVKIDPLVQAGAKLKGSDEQGEGLLGVSAALSTDGDTLLVGGPHDANEAQGAAWVFVRSGAEWVQQGPKLTGMGVSGETPADEEEGCAEESPEEAEECAFGNSGALSADGNTALVGEPSATDRPGSAWVFKREGTTWTRTASLNGGTGPGEGRFGKSVALSADGSTALVGDPSGLSQHGSAWVFTDTGSGWSPEATLTDSEVSRLAHFGRSVALSGDGVTALIGGPSDSGYVGAAWVFTRSGGVWSQQPGKLTGAGESGEARFGKAVALSRDGETALIGGLNDAAGHGAVWAFGRLGGSFVQEGEKLTGAAEGEPRFGYSVALSGDGTLALVGSPRGENGGTVTLFARSGTSWTSLSEQLAGQGEVGKGWAGASVALSGDGKVAAVGAPHDKARAGAAWVFTEPPLVAPPAPTVENIVPGAGPAGTAVRVKGSGFTGAEAVFFGSTAASSFAVKSALTIEAVAPPGLEGTVDVTVKTPAGVSAVNPGDGFRYTTGKAKGGGSENEDPERGGGTGKTDEGNNNTGTGNQNGQTGDATKSSGGASGGVLGSTSAAGAACRLTLRNKHLAVTGFRTVALRLQRTGTGSCSGKLTLSFNKSARGKQARLMTIGTASFWMGSASSKVLKIDLNKAGRKLFHNRKGRLKASLSVLRAVPAPKLASTASVRLTWKKAQKRVTLTK
jgi:hypothetical protein